MSDYTQAPATRMLATNCVCCGRALVDSRSVELGIGPECREGVEGGIEEDIRKIANEHIFHAAIAAQDGMTQKVLEYAELVEQLGLADVANKMRSRFKKIQNGTAKVDITIEVSGAMLKVKTPYRRGRSKDFINAWRKIPGRQFERRTKANLIPAGQKTALWSLLREYFPGKTVKGPKGLFRIPKPEPKEQTEMKLKVT